MYIMGIDYAKREIEECIRVSCDREIWYSGKNGETFSVEEFYNLLANWSDDLINIDEPTPAYRITSNIISINDEFSLSPEVPRYLHSGAIETSKDSWIGLRIVGNAPEGTEFDFCIQEEGNVERRLQSLSLHKSNGTDLKNNTLISILLNTYKSKGKLIAKARSLDGREDNFTIDIGGHASNYTLPLYIPNEPPMFEWNNETQKLTGTTYFKDSMCTIIYPQPCECGGTKAKTPHSKWCPAHE